MNDPVRQQLTHAGLFELCGAHSKELGDGLLHDTDVVCQYAIRRTLPLAEAGPKALCFAAFDLGWSITVRRHSGRRAER